MTTADLTAEKLAWDPPTPEDRGDRPVFHWSPSTRRQDILEHGLRPGSPSTDGRWHPDHICLSDSPSLAWSLSGALQDPGDHPSWDLWFTWLGALPPHKEVRFDPDPGVEGSVPERPRVKERRVYQAVPIDSLWYVATRDRRADP